MPDHSDTTSSADEAVNGAAAASEGSPFSVMEKSLKQEDEVKDGPRSRRIPVTVLWTVAAIVVVTDQITKQWALSTLADGRNTALLGETLGLVLVRNPGAAFSLATGQTWIFAVIATFVVAIIIRVSRRLVSTWWAVALGLVLGGAVGNLIDRLVREPGFLRGNVIDFIDYGGYFVGNIADIAIVLAALGIIVLSLGGWEIDGTRAGDGTRESGRAGGSKHSSRKAEGSRSRRGRGGAEPPASATAAAERE